MESRIVGRVLSDTVLNLVESGTWFIENDGARLCDVRVGVHACDCLDGWGRYAICWRSRELNKSK